MKYLAVYEYEKTKSGWTAKGKGNIDCTFKHRPPTLKEIREIENEIKNKSGADWAIIVNLLELSEDK